MFRDTTGSVMDVKSFGIGSTISGEWDNRYLIIGAANTREVFLLDLKTMRIIQDSLVAVADVNCLSKEEARILTSKTPLPWTFTDYELDPKGLKFVCDNKKVWV